MCSCRETAPIHLYDTETSLLRNLLGRSFGSSADPPAPAAPYSLCDCGASYLASAFASEGTAMVCIAVALAAGWLWGRSPRSLRVLIGLWTGLIGFGVVGQLLGRARGLATCCGPADYAGPLIEEYGLRFLASLPMQLAVDALVLFVVPASLAFAARRAATPRSARSTPNG